MCIRDRNSSIERRREVNDHSSNLWGDGDEPRAVCIRIQDDCVNQWLVRERERWVDQIWNILQIEFIDTAPTDEVRDSRLNIGGRCPNRLVIKDVVNFCLLYTSDA